jgi:hypothetical protein
MALEDTSTVEGLVQWWLPPEHNRHQLMSKLTTSLHLGLSETLPAAVIKPENIKVTLIFVRSFFYTNASRPLFVLTVIIALQSETGICSPTG